MVIIYIQFHEIPSIGYLVMAEDGRTRPISNIPPPKAEGNYAVHYLLKSANHDFIIHLSEYSINCIPFLQDAGQLWFIQKERT